MISLARGGSRLPWQAVALAVGIGVFSGSSALAGGRGVPAAGTLGYGGPGVYPGFQGFGLGYHPGYGYGGAALGVGAEGGFPFYSGPGYPHPWPQLRRRKGIVPFPYDGGPGSPSPDHPNYFGVVGPLVPTPQVIGVGVDRRDPSYTTGYGCFTGVLPYPEEFLAPFTARAAAGASSRGVNPSSPSTPTRNPAPAPGLDRLSAATPPATGEPPSSSPAGRFLGIDVEPVVDAGGLGGLKVSHVYPGTAAEGAGLRPGDVIYTANGYPTAQPGILAWIIANAAPDDVLMMSVRTASDGKEHPIRARLP